MQPIGGKMVTHLQPDHGRLCVYVCVLGGTRLHLICPLFEPYLGEAVKVAGGICMI